MKHRNPEGQRAPGTCEIRGGPDAAVRSVCFRGDWTRENRRLGLDEACAEIGSLAGSCTIHWEVTEIGAWDSVFLAALVRLRNCAAARALTVDPGGLTKSMQRLLHLALAGPVRARDQEMTVPEGPLQQLGLHTLTRWEQVREVVRFVGEVSASLARLVRGKAQVRWRDILAVIYETGPRALPIITLVSFLVGLILAFVGAIQLRMFGAQIYVADLVGIGIIREMGAIMTGVVMSGRTGAAFAAELGTMEANEEIDAFRTLGISHFDFLVLPRMIGLTLMMPVLCVYADLMGVLGGMLVGVTMLDLNVLIYWNETVSIVTLNDFAVGVFTSFVFGILIATAGCLRGSQCGRNSAAVGFAATSAVVTSIIWMVVATALITVACDVLGI